MEKLGEQEVWMEEGAIKDILEGKITFLNTNIFHKDPALTCYPCYRGMKVKLIIEKVS